VVGFWGGGSGGWFGRVGEFGFLGWEDDMMGARMRRKVRREKGRRERERERTRNENELGRFFLAGGGGGGLKSEEYHLKQSNMSVSAAAVLRQGVEE